MKHGAKRVHLALVLVAMSCALAWPSGTRAVPIDDKAVPGALKGVQPTTPSLPAQGQDPGANVSVMLGAELQRGSWRKACSIAADALARGEQNVDALGVFGMCAALRNDQAAASPALQRLRETEVPPHYYAAMTEGILQLRGGAADKANATFAAILKSRPADPLALYFSAEAQHQLKRDAQAIASFKAVLKRWPDNAPALASAARLLAAPKAPPQDLKEAVAMTERATAIEPMNLDYWKQMAELYERVGQHDRAAAVKLQWLSPPSLK
jgi:tetratricopeptide (TPR) repeat protein